MNKNRNKTALVFIFTLIAAVLEVYFGKTLHSHALTTEGWHMSLHLLIVGIGLIAYYIDRSKSGWILNISAFNISILLFIFASHAFIHAFRSFTTQNIELINPKLALLIAFVGLGIHLINFFVLKHHDHHHPPNSNCKDHNISAIYLHVMADLFTVLLTIVALAAGIYFNYKKADSIAGMISAVIVMIWAFKLIRSTSKSIRKAQ